MSETTTPDTTAMIAFLRKLAADLKSAKLESVADRLEEQNLAIAALEGKLSAISTICTQD